MSLDTLPNEILCLLPLYIDNIETFTNAAASCRRLRDCLYTAHPNTILRLAAASAPTFFSPHPHFLVAATARQVSDWALGNETRTSDLREAFQGGIDSLYELCLQHAGLTLEDIRRTHLARFSTINPLSDKIDKMAGRQWYSTPNFWDGGVSEPYTVATEPDRATFQIITYGELFGRSMDAFLQPEKNLPYFDLRTRIEYFTYCLPDWVCSSYPGFTRLSTGPYAPHLERPSQGDQTAMHHILHCGRWRRMWAAAIRSVLGDDNVFTDESEEDEPWRKRMLRNALQSQGLEGMQLVTLPVEKMDQEYVHKVRRMKQQIDQLNQPPPVEMLGKGTLTPVSFAPDPPNDVEIPCRDMWGPWAAFNQDAMSDEDSEDE
ncbi:hypothetical protein ABOM_003903 [Aspergillus bombycis]|uniref:F-box domain-containing protein n=1 Tax=Aspergillus bombycis TaxID=109264 RepID=A0A1F8A716_9EURO|nr:hypothetical protein ABOM_003903 [Aspergillus bombycis]OGM47189.1 hypothetical protein ABOM_003903 [Aspergillus bombycis]